MSFLRFLFNKQTYDQSPGNNLYYYCKNDIESIAV